MSREQKHYNLAVLSAAQNLHMNNKLKAVKFRHCDYQVNYIIELKGRTTNLRLCYQNAGTTDIMRNICSAECQLTVYL